MIRQARLKRELIERSAKLRAELEQLLSINSNIPKLEELFEKFKNENPPVNEGS